MTKNNSIPSFQYLKDLNCQQRRAVKHGLKDGPAPDIYPLLVIACAGSGKTKVIAYRVTHLIVKGMDPRRILLLTFSRRAATEMTNRVNELRRQLWVVNKSISRGPELSTRSGLS